MKQKGFAPLLIIILILVVIVIGYLAYQNKKLSQKNMFQWPVDMDQTPPSEKEITLVKKALDTSYSLDCEQNTNKCELSKNGSTIKEFTLPESLFAAYIYKPKNILAIATYEKGVAKDPINLYLLGLNKDENPVKIYEGYINNSIANGNPTEITDINFSPSGKYLVVDELDWELTTSYIYSLEQKKMLNDNRSSSKYYLTPNWSPDEKNFISIMASAMYGDWIEYGSLSENGFNSFELNPFPDEINLDTDWSKSQTNVYWDSNNGGIIEFIDGSETPIKYYYYQFEPASETLTKLKEKPDLTDLSLSKTTDQEQILQYKIQY